MAIAVPTSSNGRTTSGTGSTTSPSISAPASLADGEALIDVVAFNGSSLITPTAPSGHTSVISALGAASTRQGIVYRRNPTASEPASVTWSHTGALVWNMCQLRLTGADTSSLIIDQGSATATSSSSCSAPSVNNDTVGALLLYVGIIRTTSATITAYPAGMTLLYDQVTGASSNNTRLVIAYEVLSATGATGTRTATISTTQDNLAIAVIIRPAVVATVSGDATPEVSDLSLGIYTAPGGQLLLDPTSYLRSIDMSTGPHGFQALTVEMDLTPVEAFQLYDRPGLPHLVLSNGGAQTIWEGRLEDAQLQFTADGDGARLTALGYWRALLDLPYTNLWSSTRVNDWRVVLDTEKTSRVPDRYEFDTNNRLQISLKKNAAYGASTTGGSLVFQLPSGSLGSIIAVSFDYVLNAGANWYGQLNVQNSAFTDLATPWTLTSSGSLLSGSQNLTFSGTPGRQIEFLFNTTVGTTYAGEDGAWYLRITNLRIKTTTSATLLADEIARDLLSFTRTTNPTQLSASTALIQSPSLDLRDETYLDQLPGDILDRLAKLGDNQTPVRRWEVGVAEERRLYLRPRGSAGRTWYVDIGELTIERSLEQLINSVYAVYQDASNRDVRSAAATDAQSVNRYGLTRQRSVSSRTTSATQAATERDAALADGKDPRPRASIALDAVYDGTGAAWPLWAVRAGDTLVVRDLPPTISTTVDRVRTFLISETRYVIDGAGATLTVVPEEPLADLESLLARRAAGV